MHNAHNHQPRLAPEGNHILKDNMKPQARDGDIGPSMAHCWKRGQIVKGREDLVLDIIGDTQAGVALELLANLP